MSVSKENCCTCLYWQMVKNRSAEGFQDEGLCRRNPPVAIPHTKLLSDGAGPDGVEGMLCAWPRTFGESDWCGEWKCHPEYAGRYKEDE
jgi:hypothetical protein